MKFQIPQFIDVEDKIFGPFTLKQFVYLAGGASVAVASATFFGIFFGLLLASPIVVLATALAFYRVNNRPFVNIMESAFRYYVKDKLYIWKKKEPEENEAEEKEKKYSSLVVPNLSGNKLKDMSWELDVKKKEDESLAKSQDLG
ncbi:MAG: PrgI family protein [Candidatus Zambryskibacteria bacterium]